MANPPKRPGGLPATDKMKNSFTRESIVKNIPRDEKPKILAENKK